MTSAVIASAPNRPTPRPLLRISYFAQVNRARFPGVEKKIRQTVASINAAGHSAEAHIVDGRFTARYLTLFSLLWRAEADVIIIRNTSGLLFCLPALLLLRAKRRRIVIDVPTPIFSIINEIQNEPGPWLARQIKIFLHFLFFPCALLPAHRVIQYAEDSNWFQRGIARKTRVIGNGIDVGSVPARSSQPSWSGKKLVMIAVSTISNWHAYDRLLRGMSEFKKTSSTQLMLFVVGEGDARANLESLTIALGLTDQVKFFGYLHGKELDRLFDDAHVAVGTLGLFRIGLQSASTLKSREYCARGLPLLVSGKDPDFDPPPPFVHVVPNRDEAVDIAAVVSWFGALEPNSCTTMTIRKYALENLDFKQKLPTLIGLG